MATRDYYQGRVGTVRSDPLFAHFECTFSSGTPTIDAAQSDPGITITRDAAGDYDVAGLPRGVLLHPLGLKLDLASDTPAASGVGSAQPRSLNANAGTCKVLTFARDDVDLLDPPNGARLTATFLVSESGEAPLTSPLEVAGLKAWFADDVTGFGTAGFQVTDLSGNGNHGTQTNTANQPVAGSGVLTFTPSDHYDVASAGLGLSQVARYALIWRGTLTEDAPTAIRKFFTNEAETAFRMEFNQTNGDLVLGRSADSANQLVVQGTVADWTLEHSFAFLVNGAAASVRLDGIVVGSRTFGQSVTPAFTDAINIGGVNFQYAGTMRNFYIITDRIPTEAELRFLESYI